MANTYKQFTNNDRVTIRNPLYEQQSFNKAQISSSDNSNFYTGSNASYLSVYKSGSTSATGSSLLYDVTIGRGTNASSSAETSQKYSNYSQFAKVLFGTDYTGSIYNFDLDYDDNSLNENNLNYAYFLDFSRILTKDEIRKGTLKLRLMISSGSSLDETKYIDITDTSGSTSYKNDSPTGQYGALYLSSSNGVSLAVSTPYSKPVGLVFYQAGAVVLSPFIFAKSGANPAPSDSSVYFNSNSLGILTNAATMSSDSSATDKSIGQLFISGSIYNSAQALHRSILTASFASTTEVNSTVYFCRIFNNEFNYSSNPTYLSGSKIIVKSDDSLNPPVSYITSVGLYSDDNQLLAVAKLSEPIKKTPENELIIRTRLDF